MFLKASRLFLIALCIAYPLSSLSQGIGGSIVGTVRDQSGAVVPAVLVQITNVDTAQKRLVSSDGEGRYQARELPPGTYQVKAELTGYNKIVIEGFRLGVGQNARQDITLAVAPVGEEIEVKANSEIGLIETTTPTMSTSFSDKQIRELPILSRDLNNLALLAPGVFSARSFSFANTLVPFAANGSRGRDNNFIIDSVDNNEPLYGGAAAQFTNTDLFAEYRILTNQYKAEYGRNSGSVVNIITERGGNKLRGSLFGYGQHNRFNATTEAERQASLTEAAPFYETIIGATLGGAIKKEKTWFFISYQWDRARHDLSSIYPLVATDPLSAGLTTLGGLAAASPTLASYLAIPSVANLPGQTSNCGSAASGLPTTNPCTIGSVVVLPPVGAAGGTLVPFGTFLVPHAGVFDVRDHQASGRIDHRLTNRDDLYGRYLFDDLQTPRTAGANSIAELAFFDQGLFPEWRAVYKQRTQSLGLFWTHAWATALQEVRGSFERISAQSGAIAVSQASRETLPANLVVDSFALGIAPGGTFAGTSSFVNAFPAAGQTISIGRDTRPTKIASNIAQLQYNLSKSKGAHSLKVGANFVRIQSNIRQMPSDLGEYLYRSFSEFVNNTPFFAFRRVPNLGGRGGDELPIREFDQAYFFQDDYRVNAKFTVSLGIRYEFSGQPINKIPELNSGFGAKLTSDRNNFAPRIGFSWSPDGKTAFRGGYGFFYNPTVYNIPLLAWQSGSVSPFFLGCSAAFAATLAPICTGLPTFNQTYPVAPFDPTTLATTQAAAFNSILAGTAQDTVSQKFVQPYVQNYSLSVQRQIGKDFLLEVNYVGSKGTKLFQRADLNPHTNPAGGSAWLVAPTPAACVGVACTGATVTNLSRTNSARGPITAVTNGGRSIYQALQVSGTQRLSRPHSWGGLAMTTSYTWSHMIDNTSEIFGPGVRLVNPLAGIVGTTVDAITPFAQNPNNLVKGERGNSAFDRRHRFAMSYLWTLPTPDSGMMRSILGHWQLNGFVSAQTGQPYSPVNASLSSNCVDANGDGIPINDRPDIGNPTAPLNSVALINNNLCLDPQSPDARIRSIAAANPLVAGAGLYITPDGHPIDPSTVRFVQVGRGRFNPGSAGRNILVGPPVFNVDMAALKNIPWGERYNLQFRVEVYNLLNRRNPGTPSGNVFTTDAQPVPAVTFGPVSPKVTPARAVGVIPENFIDTTDGVTGAPLFRGQHFMNTSSRKFQFAVKFLF